MSQANKTGALSASLSTFRSCTFFPGFYRLWFGMWTSLETFISNKLYCILLEITHWWDWFSHPLLWVSFEHVGCDMEGQVFLHLKFEAMTLVLGKAKTTKFSFACFFQRGLSMVYFLLNTQLTFWFKGRNMPGVECVWRWERKYLPSEENLPSISTFIPFI